MAQQNHLVDNPRKKNCRSRFAGSESIFDLTSAATTKAKASKLRYPSELCRHYYIINGTWKDMTHWITQQLLSIKLRELKKLEATSEAKSSRSLNDKLSSK